MKQLDFDDHRRALSRKSWGGYRPGSGPKPRRPGIIHHVRRNPVPIGYPVHVTIRVRSGIPTLRSRALIRDFRRSLRKACERGVFRVVHYSLQRDHVHMIVEAQGKEALGSGMKSISARLARAVNRVFGRSGPVLDGRYHSRVLRTPREVRNALAYVLLNVRKHFRQRRGIAPPVRLDEASTGRWFNGWKVRPRGPTAPGDPEVSPPHSWLLTTGWRRHGLVHPAEVPGS